MAIDVCLEFGGVCCGRGGHVDIEITGDDSGAEVGEM